MVVPTERRSTPQPDRSRPHGGRRPSAAARPAETRASGVPFASILWPGAPPAEPTATRDSQGVVVDVHLDDVVAVLVSGRAQYELEPFFRARVDDLATIEYRHDVFRDLEDPGILGLVRAFAEGMGGVRERLAQAGKSHYRYERERWVLDAAGAFCQAAREMRAALAATNPRSAGLRGLRGYLDGYVGSPGFAGLASDVERLLADLDGVRYRLRFVADRVAVGRFEPEPDYGAEILAAFEKFRQGKEKRHEFELSTWPQMDHVEAAVLDRVALLYPEVFASLDDFVVCHREFLDPVLGRFDREVQFYLAYAELMARLSQRGLRFAYPTVTAERGRVEARDAFDLALATKPASGDQPIIVNDLELGEAERMVVVSGPNQGGKTTFARMSGQLHHLAALGVPVPGTRARLPLVDAIFTHFERQERVEDLSGKLENDLCRIRDILEEATHRSLVVMNESFSSTTLHDQLLINTDVVRAILDRGCLCVAVTFLDELSTLDPSIVSMVSTVDPDEPARRTFRIVRRAADGLAYAMAIAEKHGLTYERMRRRLRP